MKAILETKDLCKYYGSAENFARLSENPALANPLFCICSAGLTARPQAKSSSMGRTSFL